MKKIICLALVFIFFGHAAYALDLDGMKEHFLRGEWKDAIREGESLLGFAKRDSENLDQLYYYLALSYMKDRNYLRVSDICEILLKEFPSSKFLPQAHYVLIDAYASSHDFTAAQANAALFLKRYPDNEHAREVEALLVKFRSMPGDSRISPPAVAAPGTDASDMDIVLASDPAGNAGP
ncbi:MAG: outer membrane protein assembly factor BamD, partial [Candidatus Omnitrophota bacterium]